MTTYRAWSRAIPDQSFDARSLLRRFAWLPASALCSILGYLLVWQRGLYQDDYVFAYSPIAWFPQFPSRMLALTSVVALANLLPSHELLARTITTLLVGADALLLGWLIWLVLGSRLAALVGAWLFLMPLFAFEAVLWVVAVSYLVSATATLLFLHVLWSSITRPEIGIRLVALLLLSFAPVLMSVESFIPVVGIAPLFGLIAVARDEATRRSWVPLTRSLVELAAFALLAGAFFVLFYTDSNVLQERGGLEPGSGLVVRIGTFLDLLVLRTVSPDDGLALTAEAFSLGLAEALRTWQGAARGCS